MAKDILMPQMGYDMTQGTVVRWVKKVGDRVHRGDIVEEIETDKATGESEPCEPEPLLRTPASPGDTIPVGEPIATVGEQGEALSEPAVHEPPPAPAAADREASAPAPGEAAPVGRVEPKTPAPKAVAGEYPGQQPHASPLARRMAEHFGIDLREVRGSGPAGRLVAADIEAAQQALAAVAPPEVATPGGPGGPA